MCYTYLKPTKFRFPEKKLVKNEEFILLKNNTGNNNACHNWFVHRSLLKLINFIIKSPNTVLGRPVMTMVMKYSGTEKFHKPTPIKIQYYTISAMQVKCAG